jgi:hypothetical protein
VRERMKTIIIEIFILDVKILCSVARDIADCAREEMGECVGADVNEYLQYSYFYSEILFLDWKSSFQ